MTIRWTVVEQYFTVVLFIFQFYPVFNFGLGTVRSKVGVCTTIVIVLNFALSAVIFLRCQMGVMVAPGTPCGKRETRGEF